MSAAGWPTGASQWWCWCPLHGGWLALPPSSWVLHLEALGPVHLPWAPHWVPDLHCCGFTTPFGRGGSCTAPTAVDKQLNRLVWCKMDGSFIVSSRLSVQSHAKAYRGVYPGVYKWVYTKQKVRNRRNKRNKEQGQLYNRVKNTLSK